MIYWVGDVVTFSWQNNTVKIFELFQKSTSFIGWSYSHSNWYMAQRFFHYILCIIVELYSRYYRVVLLKDYQWHYHLLLHLSHNVFNCTNKSHWIVLIIMPGFCNECGAYMFIEMRWNSEWVGKQYSICTSFYDCDIVNGN